jgi:hypothetical protein
LSTTSSCGEDSTLTVVTSCSAVMAKGAPVARVPLRMKPGRVVLKAIWAGLKLPCTPLRMPFRPPDRKKNCVPYCSASFNVTSAITASMRTCSGRMSTLRSMASIVSVSRAVP